MNRLGRHAAHIATVDEQNFIPRSHAGVGGRVAGRSFSDDDSAIASGLPQNGPDGALIRGRRARAGQQKTGQLR